MIFSFSEQDGDEETPPSLSLSQVSQLHPELSARFAAECLVLNSITFQCGKDTDLLLCTNAALCLDLYRVKEKINCFFSHRAPPGPGFCPPGD